MKQQTLCVICDEIATKEHHAFMGQISFPVCETHYENIISAYGMDEDIPRMGLQDKISYKWLTFKSRK